MDEVRLENLSRDTYTGLTNKAKLDILFDVATTSCAEVREIVQRLDKLEKLMRRRLVFDRVCSGVGGVIGGVVFWLGMFIKQAWPFGGV